MAKRFFYVCAGLLLLALAYHFGATSATAQAPGNPVASIAWGGRDDYYFAVTDNGDSWRTQDSGSTWIRTGNVFAGPTSVQPTTFGALKATFRK